MQAAGVLLTVGAVLALVTAVHEAGHWVAVRAKRGRVLRVQVGWGGTVWSGARGGTEYVVALLPVGGRIRYEGVAPGTGEAVVAVCGPVANLAFAFLLLWAAAWVAGPESMPYGAGHGDPVSYATSQLRTWAWLVPGSLVDLALTARAMELRWAVRALMRLLDRGDAASFLYVAAAVSTVSAALNLIPVPLIGTDGWHLARSLWRALRGQSTGQGGRAD